MKYNKKNLIRLIYRQIGLENKDKDMITYSNHINEQQLIIIIAVPVNRGYKNLFERLNVYEKRHLIKYNFFSLDWNDFNVLCEWYEIRLL